MKWITEFCHTEQTMTHDFNEHVKVITSFRDNKVSLIRFGTPIATYDIDEFTVTDYADMLTRIAIDAQKLHELQEVQG